MLMSTSRLALLAGIIAGASAGSTDLTEKSFDAQVFDSGKSSIVKFYAPWKVFSIFQLETTTHIPPRTSWHVTPPHAGYVGINSESITLAYG
jgi:hypothetical protein